jgi:hypothetical protein
MSSLLEYEFWVSVSFTFPSNGFRVLKFDVIFLGVSLLSSIQGFTLYVNESQSFNFYSV